MQSYNLLKTCRKYWRCVPFQDPWWWRLQVRLLFQVLRSKGHIQVVTSSIYFEIFHGIQFSPETTCEITPERNRSNAGFAGRHSRDPSSLLNMRSPMLSGELTDSMSNLFLTILNRSPQGGAYKREQLGHCWLQRYGKNAWVRGPLLHQQLTWV